MQSRSVTWNGKIYHVNRLYSSGLGEQYAATFTEGSEEKTILLSYEFVDKNPNFLPLFERCAKIFDDSLTFAKYLGSKSFWQSQLPPDGITKSEKP